MKKIFLVSTDPHSPSSYPWSDISEKIELKIKYYTSLRFILEHCHEPGQHRRTCLLVMHHDFNRDISHGTI